MTFKRGIAIHFHDKFRVAKPWMICNMMYPPACGVPLSSNLAFFAPPLRARTRRRRRARMVGQSNERFPARRWLLFVRTR